MNSKLLMLSCIGITVATSSCFVDLSENNPQSDSTSTSSLVNTEVATDSQLNTDIVTNTQLETDLYTQSQTQTQTQTITQVQTETMTQSQTQTQTQSQTQTETNTQTQIIVNTPPVAEFSYVSDGDLVQFNNESTDEDDDGLSYVWDFGSAQTSTDLNPLVKLGYGSFVVRLTVSDGIDSHWIEQTIVLEKPEVFRVEAESYSNATGEVALENAGTSVGYFKGGDHIIYSQIDLSDVTAISVSYASNTGTGSIELRADGVEGELIGVLYLESTSDWQAYVEINSDVINSLSGLQVVYVLAKEPDQNFIANFDFFDFHRGDKKQIGNNQTVIEEQVDGFCFANGVTETEHGGLGGYTNVVNEVGSSIHWAVNAANAGVYELKIRYALGATDARPGELTVNQIGQQTFDFNPTTAWTDWQYESMNVMLKQGDNSIELSSLIAVGLGNVDSLTIVGDGISPIDCEQIVEPPVVEPPIVKPPQSGQVLKITDTPIGWATQSGGTTGGGTNLSNAVTVSNMSSLQNAVKGSGAKIVLVSPGTYTGELRPGANTTIIGTAPGVIIQGNVKISGENYYNIIIRNIAVRGDYCGSYQECKDGKDAFYIGNKAHHVWVDHVDVANGQDGNFDITQEGDFVTVSWTKFSYTYDKEHRFSNLIAGSDNETNSEGKLRITYMNSWWADRVDQRQPRGRFGKVHLLNNLFSSQENGQIVHGPGLKMSMIIEANYYDLPSNVYTVKDEYGTTSGWKAFNNEGTAREMNDSAGGATFTIPYNYTPINASSVKAVVSSTQCGAGNTCVFEQ
ncbi:carbohydrate-binding protein [Marinicellulosiphila megalodicopiae]|uniref:carbohydrate-binding protein n=1 Tax=Marinicellulosiphila megalodicopiae TaxID=2724896 RepID=UPI003BB02C4C